MNYGEFTAATTSVLLPDRSEANIGAICVYRKKKMNTIITSIGSTHCSHPKVLKRKAKYILTEDRLIIEQPPSQQQQQHTINLPDPLQTYFANSGAVDNHNQARQGDLKLEERWHTKCWQTRFLTTMIGIYIVNAYYAYRFEKNNRGEPYLSFPDFAKRLSLQLCLKKVLKVPVQVQSAENHYTIK